MTRMTSKPTRRRLARIAQLGALSVVTAALLVGCGSSAPASTVPLASTATVTPSAVAPSVPASAPDESSAASTAPASAPAAADPAAGLKIGAPYTLTTLPGGLQQALESQMAGGLGSFGSSVQAGFRQVGGSSGSILMVIAFPAGSLSASAYQAAVAVMGSSMGATFTTTTVSGVDVASGKATTGGVAMFHIADHLLVVISPVDTESLPIATALITANQ